MADETAQGINAFGALTDQERKTAAYNALSKSYGPAVAYDPQAANAAAQASAQMPLAPETAATGLARSQADLAGTQADTAGKVIANTSAAGDQQRVAAYRAAQMLKSAADPNTGVIPPDAYDKIVRPNASLLGIDPAHVDAFGQMLAQPGGANHLDQISQSLIGPTKVTGAVSYGIGQDGKPVAITKDQYGNIRQTSLGGTETVAQQNANTNVVNSGTKKGMLGVAEQNASTNRYRANTTANNSLFGNPGGPLPGDNRPSANGGGGNVLPAPSVDRIGAGNPPGTVTDPQALFNRLPPKGKSQAISQATQIVNQGTNLGTTNQILGTVLKQISPYTAGTGSMLKDLPGTAQADLKANLATLKAQGLMSWISSLKNAGGQTGIGRVLQSEANAATNLYGNMEQDQSAKQLAFHAGLFQQTVNKLYQHSGQAFKAMYGVQPHEAIGTDEPNTAGAPTLPGGWKYLGVAK